MNTSNVSFPVSVYTIEEVPVWLRQILGTILLLASFFGFLENGAVLYIYRQKKYVRTQIFPFLLAAVDLFLAIATMPLVSVSFLYGEWIFGEIGCVYYGFVLTITGLTSILFVTILAIDRYFLVVQEKPTIRHSQIKNSALFIGGITTLFWSVAPLVGWNRYTFEVDNLHCAINWRPESQKETVYCISLLVMYYVVPLTIIVFCYGKIFNKFRGNKAKLNDIQIFRRQQKEKTVAITMALIIGAFFLSWTPYAILSFYILVSGSNHIPPSLAIIPATIAKSSIVWNPIIYFRRSWDFRRAANEVFPFLKTWWKPQIDIDVNLACNVDTSNKKTYCTTLGDG